MTIYWGDKRKPRYRIREREGEMWGPITGLLEKETCRINTHYNYHIVVVNKNYSPSANKYILFNNRGIRQPIKQLHSTGSRNLVLWIFRFDYEMIYTAFLDVYRTMALYG